MFRFIANAINGNYWYKMYLGYYEESYKLHDENFKQYVEIDILKSYIEACLRGHDTFDQVTYDRIKQEIADSR